MYFRLCRSVLPSVFLAVIDHSARDKTITAVKKPPQPPVLPLALAAVKFVRKGSNVFNPRRREALLARVLRLNDECCIKVKPMDICFEIVLLIPS